MTAPKKRKSPPNTILKAFIDCKIENLPQKAMKKTTKMLCEVCLQKKKEIKIQRKASQTNFYCVTHNVHACVIAC